LVVNSERARFALGALVLILNGSSAQAEAVPATPAAKPAPAPAAASAPAAAKVASAAPAAAPAAKAAPAAPAAKPAAPAAAKPPSFSQVLGDLASTDRTRVEAALGVLEAKPDPRGVTPLAARIRDGLPPELVVRAIKILAVNRGGSSATVLRELLSHRRTEVRKAAVDALGSQGARAQAPALLPLLNDPEPTVRSASLAALATLGERRALEPAFSAVENGSSDAVLCIARLAQPADLERLVGLTSQRPFGALQPAFELLLGRSDFPPRGKLDLVARIGRLGTAPAQDYLRDYLNRVPEPGKKPMMVAIGKALQTGGLGPVAEPSTSTRTTTTTSTGAKKGAVKP
jgi:hypothetical protein